MNEQNYDNAPAKTLPPLECYAHITLDFHSSDDRFADIDDLFENPSAWNSLDKSFDLNIQEHF